MRIKFGIFFVALFMSSINSNAKSETDPYTCWDVADDTVQDFRGHMLKLRRIATHENEYNVWEAAYDGCMGN
ncbi:hypothetical protein SAMN05428642_101691 [Flaviramulus basaltis]|uniref:Uncharacterized protein n=1 Tax=Flaviramulus basaltis TaxID=369401 RepID=A0A1K2IC57_9FLAO|nr:hypothetical protein [Flaviramulus basaltis]SFZ90012.1 hypothetical protein SAMN05428642_101691 [Flaviramulus basaltis]